MRLISNINKRHKDIVKVETLTLDEYLEELKGNASVAYGAHERLLKAIGEPTYIYPRAEDDRLSRLYSDKKVLRTWKCFEHLHGMETVLEQVVDFIKNASLGLEEAKQILYLLGPVGGGKSTIATTLAKLMEQEPMYWLEDSPIYESPLSLLTQEEVMELGLSPHLVPTCVSQCLLSRIGNVMDAKNLVVCKAKPSVALERGIVKTPPSDENNQDVSMLVGKTDISKLAEFTQADPESYSYTGAFGKGNNGLVDFVEMFKAPIKSLHPCLTATQENDYAPTAPIGKLPFNGIILAHSNESEWQKFKENKDNEAFLDRVNIVKVPYCLRYDDEIKIYKQQLQHTALADAPCAPEVFEILAKSAISTRLTASDTDPMKSKIAVYNGEDLKDTDPNAKSYEYYKDNASKEEGFRGLSTRDAFLILNKAFGYDPRNPEVIAPQLLKVMKDYIKEQDKLTDTEYDSYVRYESEYTVPDLVHHYDNVIQKAFFSSYNDYGQNKFDNYVLYADHWVQDKDYMDPDTGNIWDRDALNNHLSDLEKAVGIANPKDFRQEIVSYCLRYQAKHNGNNPKWTSYHKIKEVIQKSMMANAEMLIPVISFDTPKDNKTKKQHKEFLENMKKKGYSENATKTIVQWWQQKRNMGS